jgi:hypothetical protein
MAIAFALIVGILFTLITDLRIAEADTGVHTAPVFGPANMPFGWECLCGKGECGWCGDDETQWSEFHADAVTEFAAEFTALFEGYEFKVAKNGRGMIRTGNAGPYKFVKMGG